jgi:hypothetical protein
MKRFFILTVLLFLSILGIIASRYAYIKVKYPVIIEDIESNRIKFLDLYTSSTSMKEKKEIIEQARIYLHETFTTKIFPSWFGTPWSFNGDADFPFQGSIACGSFVEKTLKHGGFRVDDRLSSQPSEYIIQNMVSDDGIKRFSNIPLHTFNDEIQNLGEGIYVIGLDTHVGFLYILENRYRFVHSHGRLFVLSQPPSLSLSLRRSKYRVVGKLFDSDMIENWLFGKTYSLKFDYFSSKL